LEIEPLNLYLKRLCKEKLLSPSEVVGVANIERTYGLQIFRGIKNPSRDKVIQLAFGFALNLDETQQLLKAANKKVVVKCYLKENCNIQNLTLGFLRSLNHKGLAKFYESYGNVTNFFVLQDYVEGITLSQYVNERLPSEKETISIIEQLCDILIYIHSQKLPIIHRDIKPSNIIINDGKITLIDFGSCGFFDDKLIEDTLYLGTKGFAPPEQYGYAQTDRRANIYAVGMVLLYLCTGNIDLKNTRTIRNKHFSIIIKNVQNFL